MSLRISQWIGLIGIVATIPLVQTVAVAKSPVEINRIAKSITVLITSSSEQGSGVILQRQGGVYTVLTAAHVVKNKANYKITTPDNLQYEVISSSIRTSPGDIDLAVVKFKSTNSYTTVKLGNCNKIEGGMDIYVSGFPAPDEMITSVIFAFRKALVTGNSNKVFRDGYSLVYDGNTLPGMSGGGVFNSNGELVAIHGKGDRNKDENGRNAEKNNYNAGISINRFQMVASSLGIELNGQVTTISSETTPKADDYYVSGLQKYNRVPTDYQGALADYNRAIQLNPNYTAAYKNRARTKHLLGDDKGALADYNQAIQLNPSSAETYLDRGSLKGTYLQDYQGGLADYDQAIKLNSSISFYNGYNPGFYFGRGDLKEKLRDYRGALADYDQGIKLDSKNLYAYKSRASLRIRLRDYQGAMADYDRAIQIAPDFASLYYSRAIFKHDYVKDQSGAINDMNKAAKLFQANSNMLNPSGSYQDAIKYLEKWQ